MCHAARSDPPVATAITWLGHATVLIESGGVSLLTDPVLRDRIGPLIRIAPPGGVATPQSVDCVLLSHLHADHADLPSLHRVVPPAQLIVPHPAARWLRRHHFRDPRELRAGEEVTVGGIPVVATPAIHARRRHPGGPAADPIGYLVGAPRGVYFAGDTDLFEGMAELRGQVAVALLPVWGWGPRLGPGHLDPERAARAAATIAPEIVIPIHWGTFVSRIPRGRMEDPARPAKDFVRLTRRYAPGVETRLLAPGERIEV